MLVTKSGEVMNSSQFVDKVVLHVRQKEISTLVITTVVIIIIGVFALVVISLKYLMLKLSTLTLN